MNCNFTLRNSIKVMIATEKAKELVFKYRQLADWNNEFGSAEEKTNIEKAKQCSLIAVNAIINNQMSLRLFYDKIELVDNVNYWQEIKTEIEKI